MPPAEVLMPRKKRESGLLSWHKYLMDTVLAGVKLLISAQQNIRFRCDFVE